MQPLRPAFDLKISMLAAQYFASDAGGGKALDQRVAMQALMTAEQARARALADFRKLDESGPGLTRQQVEQRQTLYRELASRRFQLENRLASYSSADARVALLRGEIATLRQQLDRINVAMTDTPAPGKPDANDKAKRGSIDLRTVPTDTALVEYWFGADEAFAWVLTREQLVMKRIGTTAEVNDAARAFHSALRSFGSVPAAERLRLGEQLYSSVVQPIAPFLSDKHTLIFAQDGALHYVPFAALRSAEGARSRFLVELHDVAVTPSITQLLAEDRRGQNPPARQMLLVDDPVYGSNDARVVAKDDPKRATQATANIPSPWVLRGASGQSELPRLPGTAQEAATVAALLPKGQVEQLEGFAANRDRFLGAGLGQYRFIHVASHAVTDSEIPQLSALILSTADRQGHRIDGRVLAADFMNTQLNAEVVVLSACETALGRNIAGEGLVGLRYVVIARGAMSVMASLWQVPDRATAEFMTRFYSSLLPGGSSVTAASSVAMRGMINAQMADPALWAAFAVTVRDLGRT